MLERVGLPCRRRKQPRPRELLDAARDLFVEKGFPAARAEDIAARAGVSKVHACFSQQGKTCSSR